jgi:hypothetical protein
MVRKLGRLSGRAGSIGISGTHEVVSILVAFASTTSDVEVGSSTSLLVLGVIVHWVGREPDG